MCNCGNNVKQTHEQHVRENQHQQENHGHHQHCDHQHGDHHNKCGKRRVRKNACVYVSCFDDKVLTPYEIWLDSCRFNTNPCPNNN
jgi:hypothetical protein